MDAFPYTTQPCESHRAPTNPQAIHVLNAEKDRERTDEAAAATKKRGRASKAADESEALDIWGDAAPEATRRQGVAGPAHGDSTIAQGKRTRGPRRAPVRKAPIPAVEVAAPGTSYHPSFEDHQDAVAEAVAEEMRKELRQELGPNVSKVSLPRSSFFCPFSSFLSHSTHPFAFSFPRSFPSASSPAPGPPLSASPRPLPPRMLLWRTRCLFSVSAVDRLHERAQCAL